MAKKNLFWSVTTILFLISAYVLTTTVILPVVSINPLPEAVSPKAEAKKENNTKKQDRFKGSS
jgi:hypothetical protein